MTKVIVVVGATGTQGGSVVRTFNQLEGWEVRAITRNIDSPAARKLQDLGIQTVKVDLGDVESLKVAFSGANAIFGVTDFWQFVQSPWTYEIDGAKRITWNEACCLREVEQGKNIIDAAAYVVKQGSLDRLVLSSLNNVRKASCDKYKWVYHFDGKAKFVQYLKDEAQQSSQHRLLLERTSYIHVGNYLDNWAKNPILRPEKEEDGTVVFRDIVTGDETIKESHKTPFVHPPTDTGPFVQTLITKVPPGTTMLGTSSLIHYADYVKMWGEIQGVRTKIKALSISDVDKTWPGGFGLEVAETVCYVREFGWDGGEGTILPEDAGVDMGALTTVTDYIKTTNWSSVLGDNY